MVRLSDDEASDLGSIPVQVSDLYQPQTKLWEGNVFIGVCHSVNRESRVQVQGGMGKV